MKQIIVQLYVLTNCLNKTIVDGSDLKHTSYIQEITFQRPQKLSMRILYIKKLSSLLVSKLSSSVCLSNKYNRSIRFLLSH